MGARSGLIQRLRCSRNFLPLHLKKWQALLDLPLGGTECLRVAIDSLFETGQWPNPLRQSARLWSIRYVLPDALSC